MKRLILMMMLMLTVTFAYAQDVEVSASWIAPTEGSPVVNYVLELSEDGGPYVVYGSTEQTTMILLLKNFVTYTARVSGIDAQDRQGPWSNPSEPYTVDIGPPGQPGQPIILGE
jgi:hypothetical protein